MLLGRRHGDFPKGVSLVRIPRRAMLRVNPMGCGTNAQFGDSLSSVEPMHREAKPRDMSSSIARHCRSCLLAAGVMLVLLALVLATTGDANADGAELRAEPILAEKLPLSSEPRFQQVSAGQDHTCGVLTSGEVACWGRNANGEATPPEGTFRQVSAGLFHTCGVKTDGEVDCWGWDDDGQATPPEATFKRVSAGNYHTCGVLTSDEVACWGADWNGQSSLPEGTFRQEWLTWDNTCGVMTDDEVSCWGLQVRSGPSSGVAATPVPSTTAQPPTCTAQVTNGDYDVDNDGLIEICHLSQLDAIRYDLDGDGVADAQAYADAFPDAAAGMGCPSSGCSGYELVADLDFDTDGNGQADAYWNDGAGWEPIGREEILSNGQLTFYGWDATFDGGGHTISNLFINRTERQMVGLFTSVLSTGYVRNIGLIDVNISGRNAGALAGFSEGTITASYVTGSVSASGDYSTAGGLVASHWPGGSITASYVTGSVSASGDYSTAGGLVGSNYSGGGIATSYATSSVSGSNTVGGLVGVNHGTITSSYWDIQTSGLSISDGGEGKTTRELQSPIDNTGIYANWNPSVWDFGTGSQYPRLKRVAASGVAYPDNDGDYDTDDDGLIEVVTLAQLDAIRYDLDGDGTPWKAVYYDQAFPNAAASMGCPSGGCRGYELAANLDFDTNGSGGADAGDAYWNAGAGWAPLGRYFDGSNYAGYETSFATTFHGNGYTISNLYIDRPDQDYVGLFGYAYQGSFVAVDLVSVDVAGHFDVGSLVGFNHAGTVTSSSASGKVAGQSDVGGLVGSNSGTVTTSYAASSVTSHGHRAGGLIGHNTGTVIANYASSNVTGQFTAVGGLVALNNRGRIIAGYAMGSVAGDGRVGGLVGLHMNEGTITASLATGSVTGNETVGGLVGDNFGGAITASYWGIQTSGRTIGVGEGSTSGAAGKTTAELQAPTDYTGIYAGWNVDLDNADGDDDITTGGDAPWDFGTSSQYPMLKNIGPRAAVQQRDRAALIALYEATDGNNWDRNAGWNTEAPLGEWHGVTTDANGRVAELRLGNNNLSGTMPAELGDLSKLTVLDLYKNKLTGTIPPELGNLNNLTHLNLYRNWSGDESSGLTGWSGLSGEIPSELGNLSNLTELNLYFNRLTGAVPPELGNLSHSLKELNLGYNQLSGPIPSELGDLTNLILLSLRPNQLSGEIPVELGQLENLQYLYLGTGFSPAETQWYPTDYVKNQLRGCVPERWRNLPAENDLATLNLNFCDAFVAAPSNLSLTSIVSNPGEVIFSWAPGDNATAHQVAVYDKTFEAVYGKFVTGNASETTITGLTLGQTYQFAVRAGRNGGWSQWVWVAQTVNWAATEQEEPLVAPSHLTARPGRNAGEVILSWQRSTDSTVPTVYEVAIRKAGDQWMWGPRDLSRTATGTTITKLEQGQNYYFAIRVRNPRNNETSKWVVTKDATAAETAEINNDLPALVTFYGATLRAGTNWKRNPEDEDYCGIIVIDTNEDYDLTDNIFKVKDLYSPDSVRRTGINPVDGMNEDEIRNLNWLCGVTADAETGRVTKLNLESMDLRGSILGALRNLTHLTELDLSDNGLHGSIPKELGKFTNLKTLDLSNNRLSGSIPKELGNLSSLTVFDLSHNKLGSGEVNPDAEDVPETLGNLTKLKTLDLSNNRSKGLLAGGGLSGGLPLALARNENLTDIDLSHNLFAADLAELLGAFNSRHPGSEFEVDIGHNNWQTSQASVGMALQSGILRVEPFPIVNETELLLLETLYSDAKETYSDLKTTRNVLKTVTVSVREGVKTREVGNAVFGAVSLGCKWFDVDRCNDVLGVVGLVNDVRKVSKVTGLVSMYYSATVLENPLVIDLMDSFVLGLLNGWSNDDVLNYYTAGFEFVRRDHAEYIYEAYISYGEQGCKISTRNSEVPEDNKLWCSLCEAVNNPNVIPDRGTLLKWCVDNHPAGQNSQIDVRD